jgi:asparagine synthase (glutamine-hydrolysing)
MCGIAGVFNFNSKPVEINQLREMGNSMHHRGPDGEGFWISDDAEIGFAHRRLSIIDLSEKAGQPMHFRSRYTIVYNGEIYNYIELRQSLIKNGYTFQTDSDTEVILASYDFLKEKCLETFDGMFAFAIWDEKEKRLFCARDRYAEKPFHYSFSKNHFIFSSEIKTLFKAAVEKKIDRKKVEAYLHHNEAIYFDQTFFEGIKKLPHAHYAIVEKGNISIYPYYKLNNSVIHRYQKDEDYVDHFLNLFELSIKRRLRSDVPIGSSFSGGLDSSGIVCDLHKLYPNLNYKLFSARFEDKEKDEGKWMKYVVDHTTFEQVNVTIIPENIVKFIEKIVYHNEIPVGSTSIAAQFLLMHKINEQNIKVVLDGQGADEILGGYGHYRYHYLYDELYQWRFGNFLKQKKIYNSLYNQPIRTGYLPIIKLFLAKLIYPGNCDNVFYKSFKNRLQEDFHKNLPLLLSFADRNAMAFGVEVRLPFLFHELVDFTMSLPVEQIYRNAQTKFVYRNAIRKFTPAEIVERKDKLGYAPPQDKWMHHFLLEEKNELINQGYRQSPYAWRNYITHVFLKVAAKL